MANQKQVQRQSQTNPEEVSGDPEGLSPERQAELDAIKAETDSMLDEIDSVLEQNAEAFVQSYIQKPGE